MKVKELKRWLLEFYENDDVILLFPDSTEEFIIDSIIENGMSEVVIDCKKKGN